MTCQTVAALPLQRVVLTSPFTQYTYSLCYPSAIEVSFKVLIVKSDNTKQNYGSKDFISSFTRD